jgi:hypothetical protein
MRGPALAGLFHLCCGVDKYMPGPVFNSSVRH